VTPSPRRRMHRTRTPADPTPRTTAPAGRDRGALARAAVLIGIVWLAAFAPQLAGGKVFLLGDARIYRPFSDFSRERWQQQHVHTFWNPYVLCGVSASASLADMRPQYLPGPLLDAVEAVRPGRVVPMATPLLAHLAGMLAMAAIAWLLWSAPWPALAFAGLAYGFTPLLLVPLAFGHDAFFAAAGLLPLAVLALLALFEARDPVATAGLTLALAAVTGIQALTGHPQMVTYTGGLLVAFGLERAWSLRRPGRFALVLLALAAGVAMSAAVWQPAIAYGKWSIRGGAGITAAEARGLSLEWYELPSLLWPAVVGGANNTYWGGIANTDYPRFMGTLVALFAVAGLLARRAWTGPARGFLAGVLVVSLALALGPRLLPVFELSRQLPFFDKFRVSSMSLVPASFAAALLAAAALSGPAGTASRGGRAVAWIAGGAAALALTALGLAMAAGRLDDAYTAIALHFRPDHDSESLLFAARAAGRDLAWRATLAFAGVALLAAWRARRPAWAGAALVAMLVLDLGAVSQPFLARATGAAMRLEHPQEPVVARLGAEHPDVRVLSLRALDVHEFQTYTTNLSPEARSNDWIRWGAKAYGGEHGTPQSTWKGLLMLRNIEAIRSLGVAYVSDRPGKSIDTLGMTRVATTPDEIVYHFDRALGRAYAVPRVEHVPTDTATLRRLLSNRFDPFGEAFCADPAAAGEYPGSDSLRITWRRDAPDTLALALEAPARAFLVIADTWFPGWTARLDGREVPIRRVDIGLRGVEVPPGAHALEMTFVPEGWAAGLRWTRGAMLAWLLASLATAAAWWARRRAAQRLAAPTSKAATST
jgi:hypothetical protein